MKVVLNIGRLVVHGASAFDREAFEAALRTELLLRLPAGTDAGAVARRLGAAGPSFEADRRAPELASKPASAFAETAAGGIARRLLP